MENNNIEEIVINEDGEYEYDKYGKRVWNVPMNTDSKYLSDKHIDYKWYALFNVNSNSKNEETPNHETGNKYGIECSEDHRYIYENKIRESMELLEEMSRTKRRCILSNIKKLSEVSNGLVVLDKTENGEIVYRIYNKTSLNKDGDFNKYVLIPSDILKLLIGVVDENKSNNNYLIKIYCVLLIKCNINDWETLSNKYFAKCLGVSEKSGKIRGCICGCLDTLCMYKLIDKQIVIDTSEKDKNGKKLTKEYNQYKLRNYSDWREYYEERCCKRVRKHKRA